MGDVCDSLDARDKNVRRGGGEHARPIKQGDGIYDVEGGRKSLTGR